LISIIDYGAGNIKSVYKAFSYIGADVNIVSDYESASTADALVFPGVGSFDDSINSLRTRGLDKTILEAYDNEKPFFGICLGLQMLFEKSEEGKEKGIEIFKGEVKRIPENLGIRVPHIGWDNVKFRKKSEFDNEQFYFVHSYYARAKDRDIVLATCDYGVETDVIIKDKSFIATQFHPEKSSKNGLQILKNWVEKIKL
jgi:glutamine amidotransferase